MVENLPKSRLKCFLVGKRSSGSKPVGSGNQREMEQSTVSTMTAKKQRRRENTKQKKPKDEPNWWNLAIYRE